MEPSTNTKPMLEHLQPSVLVIVLRLLAVLFMLDIIYAFIILGFFSLNDLHDWHNSYILFLWLVHAAKYLIITFAVIKLFAQWAGRNYYLSGHHLIERLGLFNITETTHELSQVKSIVVRQTWLGRRFNYGIIKLSFAGAAVEQEIIIRDVNDPIKYKKYFDEHLQVQGWIR